MFCNFELVMRLQFKLTRRFDLQPVKYTCRLEGRIFAGSYDDFNANFSFMFQSAKNLWSSHISMFWDVLYFLGDFEVYLGMYSFLQSISKILGKIL